MFDKTLWLTMPRFLTVSQRKNAEYYENCIGIGRGRFVGLFLWLLEFQQGIKYFVGGYVRIVILT